MRASLSRNFLLERSARPRRSLQIGLLLAHVWLAASMSPDTRAAAEPDGGHEPRPTAAPAPANPTAAGYDGIWFRLGQVSEYGDKYSGGLGTYTAKHIPLAIYSAAASKTFFVYGGTVPGRRHLLIMAGCYDHATGMVPRPTVVHDKQGVNDPHDNASLALDEAGHVWVFVSGRSRTRPGFKYRSRAPLSIEAFERVSEEEMTYPQPWWLPGRGFLHLFTKYTAGRELYWETSPDGISWSDDQKLAGMGGHYQISAQRESRVITAFNMHPAGNVDCRTNLYFLETTDMGRTWTTADGTVVLPPLTDPQTPALVRDFQADGNPDSFSESHLYFTDAAANAVWLLPPVMAGDWARPEVYR